MLFPLGCKWRLGLFVAKRSRVPIRGRKRLVSGQIFSEGYKIAMHFWRIPLQYHLNSLTNFRNPLPFFRNPLPFFRNPLPFFRNPLLYHRYSNTIVVICRKQATYPAYLVPLSCGIGGIGGLKSAIPLYCHTRACARAKIFSAYTCLLSSCRGFILDVGIMRRAVFGGLPENA